jgi:hypothetical protein
MSLKRNWLSRKKEKENKSKGKSKNLNKKGNRDLYTQLQEEVQKVRQQGGPPQKDPMSFSQYVCDLCSTTHPIAELRQCAVCGRWACPECWTEKYYLCNSCGGIVELKSVKL